MVWWHDGSVLALQSIDGTIESRSSSYDRLSPIVSPVGVSIRSDFVNHLYNLYHNKINTSQFANIFYVLP